MEIWTRSRRPVWPARLLVNAVCTLTILLAATFIVPAALGLERHAITDTSMSGSYDLGSVVFEEVVPVNDLVVGDVITYLPPTESGIDHPITHRIVSIEDGDFQTKGDAVDQVDPWTFRLESVSQPRVAYSVPYVGWVLIALQDRSVRVALIGLFFGLVALIGLGQLAGASRRRRPAAARTFATTGSAAPAAGTVALHGAVQLLRRSR